MICFIKIESENMTVTWNISSFIFCIICSLFGNMKVLHFCEYYLPDNVVLSVLSLLWNRCNLTLKLNPKN